MGGETPSNGPPELPGGLDFLQLVRALEDACDATTRQRLPFMGEKAPALVAELSDLLSLLDRAGSCWWGCAGGDHLIEYIVGGSCGTTRAGLRLAYLGFYDEALSLSRFIGERGNLLALFLAQPDSMERWRQTDATERWKRFSAVRVRLALEEAGATVPTHEDRYRRLSSFGSHPGRVPQQHTPGRNPRQGGVYDEAGFLLGLNELGRAIILVAGLAAPLLTGKAVPGTQILDTAASVAHQLGGVTVTEVDDLWAHIQHQGDDRAGGPDASPDPSSLA